MTDAELVMYVVKQDDTSLGGANGSGYKLPVSEGLVTTDGTNPVSVNGGGVINLNGGTLDWPGTPVSGNIVVTEGDQTLYNKTLLPRDQEVGPKIDIRDTDLRLIKSQVTDPEDFGTRAIFSMALLDELNDFTYQLPKNDGNSVLVDHQTAQTLTNKTLEEPIINVVDSELLLRDSTGSGRTARFEVGGAGTEDFIFTLPQPADLSSTLIDGETPQTLTNKTLTTPTIGSFTNAQHDHSDAANGGTLSGLLSMDRILWLNGVTMGSTTSQEYTVPATAAGGILMVSLWTDQWLGVSGANMTLPFSYDEDTIAHDLYAVNHSVPNTTRVLTVSYSASTHKLTLANAGAILDEVFADIILFNEDLG